jgi:hypothetical protein
MRQVRQPVFVLGDVAPVPDWQQPNLNAQPWTDNQKMSAAARVKLALAGAPFLNRDISLFNAPADSKPFVVTPTGGTIAQPFVAYPAPGAGPSVVIQRVVPKGLMDVITKIAIVHVGGNPPDGTGNVVWRLLINGAGVDGLNNLNSQLGTYAQPNDFVIMAIENDIVQVTVEVPAGQPAMPAGQSTAARFHGWSYPLVQATQVTPGAGSPIQ